MKTGHKGHSKRLLFSFSLLALVVLTAAQPSRADLYSVAFKTYNPSGNSPLISGPEPAAT